MDNNWEYTPAGKRWLACRHMEYSHKVFFSNGMINIQKSHYVSFFTEHVDSTLDGCTCVSILQCSKCGWSTCGRERATQKYPLEPHIAP